MLFINNKLKLICSLIYCWMHLYYK